LQVVFYLTPIMWAPNLLPKSASLYLLDFNPMYHLFEIVRAPLLGQTPTMANWVVCLGMAVVGWGGAILLYGRYRFRIAYWL
jgi:ABC-type polysaccharide/polyol phosphate export permease